MISLQAAWTKLKDIQSLTEPEFILISESVERYAAEDVIACHDSPPFTQSRFDGYALGSPGESPSLFRIITNRPITAGDGSTFNLSKGEAVPIMTGAPIPDGAAEIVPNEYCRIERNILKIRSLPVKSRMFLEKGEDFKKGDIYLKRGEKITPVHVAFMALDGREEISVFSRPNIAIICSGDELEAHTETSLKKGKIRNSHPELIKALLAPHGKPQVVKRLPDNLGIMKETLRDVFQSDSRIIITTGGMGQGVKDLTRQAIREAGAIPLFEGIEAVPIGTFSCYRYNKKTIFSLPGGMVGVILLIKLFVLPFVRMAQGWTAPPSPGPFVKAKIDEAWELSKTGGNSRRGTRFIKAFMWDERGTKRVAPLKMGSQPLTKMNAFIVLEPNTKEKHLKTVSVFKVWNV